MLSIGALASAAQGASYYERDGYYAKDDPEHQAASAWAGKGAEELGLKGPVDPETFKAILEGKVPDGSDTRLGRRGKDGEILHRPGRDLTFSAPKSVSIAALVGGDDRIVEAHDRAVTATLGWIEKNAAETRMKDPETGKMGRVGGQKIVAATFRHDTSRNLDPQLHSHAVLANMVQGEDGKWRSMANEGLYARQKLIGMLYRNELAGGLARLGYGIEKTHADGRFEIAGVSRHDRGVLDPARRDRGGDVGARARQLRGQSARRRARGADDAGREARHRPRGIAGRLAETGRRSRARCPGAGRSRRESALPEREAVGTGKRAEDRGGGSGATSPETPGLPGEPGSRGPGRCRRRSAEVSAASPCGGSRRLGDGASLGARGRVRPRRSLRRRAGPCAGHGDHRGRRARGRGAGEGRDAARRGLPGAEDSLATAKTVAEERETVSSMRAGQGRGTAPMRGWQVQEHLNKGPLTAGQKDAVKLILSAEDRVIGVQGYAGSGKTTMLDRARTLAGKKGYRMIGLAPSASAVQTLASEAGIESETLQRFLARNAGVAEGRLTTKGAKEMRAAFAKTILVVDEGSLASTVQARDLLRIANELRMPRVVLVGDAKQLDAVDAGKPFAQLQAAGMKTAVMDEIMRQRDPALKEAVETSLKGDIGRAFEKLGSNVAEVKSDNIAGAVAARWLRLGPEARENTGVMAPSHALRQAINGHIRERLDREGRIHGPAMQSERLVSRGYTNAEKALAGNYAAGDVVAFHRPYKRIGAEKGDERRVTGVNHKTREVVLEGRDGGTVAWKPEEIGGRRGGSEVYRAEDIELRAGDRIRWTRNDAGLGLVNSRNAEVLSVANGRVTFQLEDGKKLELGRNDPQLRHLDHAWASTVHAFQGRTVDNVIAAMEARHPHLTTQKSFYVEISRARDRAELVTDDAAELRAQLQAVTGERIAALEGIGEMKREAPGKAAEAAPTREIRPERGAGEGIGKDREGVMTPAKEPETPVRDRGKGGMDLGL